MSERCVRRAWAVGLAGGGGVAGCATTGEEEPELVVSTAEPGIVEDDDAVSVEVVEDRFSITPEITILRQQTLPGVGAAQGLTERDGLIYIFGDAEVGVIREFRLERRPQPRLRPTGRDIRLTVDGEDIAPHPTGLAFHPVLGTYLGDTVSQRGTIFRIDFDRALTDGTLDNAILNTVDDDAAVNGTRPEYVFYEGRWLIATSDYGPTGNEVRLYRPSRLAVAGRTSEPGVEVASWPCGPFVQSLRWLDERELLTLVQNQVAGLRYRLTFTELEATDDLTRFESTDLERPTDELEGFLLLDGGLGIMVSAMRENNVTFVRIDFDPRPRGETETQR